MSDNDLVKRLRDLGDHAAFEPHMHHTAADRIEELEAKLAKAIWELKRNNDALEVLRPVWAQGWTNDSNAAQASGAALAQLWNMLGVQDQTQAVATLAELKGEDRG